MSCRVGVTAQRDRKDQDFGPVDDAGRRLALGKPEALIHPTYDDVVRSYIAGQFVDLECVERVVDRFALDRHPCDERLTALLEPVDIEIEAPARGPCRRVEVGEVDHATGRPAVFEHEHTAARIGGRCGEPARMLVRADLVRGQARRSDLRVVTPASDVLAVAIGRRTKHTTSLERPGCLPVYATLRRSTGRPTSRSRDARGWDTCRRRQCGLTAPGYANSWRS